MNQIPRPSHHEERVADYLCQFAERLHLPYKRDKENCVVISKPATPGHEGAEPIVLLNHMDMVCVGMKDPLSDPIEAYVENGWMKARGTSLGADNGIGLSMALAVLEDDSIVHPALEVMTTTNEEDGMSGASQLSKDFLKGRKVINLDSEDYDTITTGAAGACLQFHRIPVQRKPAPGGKRRWYRIRFEGGLGGHSGVDINKGRCSAVVPAWAILAAIYNEYEFDVASIKIGEANASIASSAEIVLTIPSGEGSEFVKQQEEMMNEWLQEEYGKTDPKMHCTDDEGNGGDLEQRGAHRDRKATGRRRYVGNGRLHLRIDPHTQLHRQRHGGTEPRHSQRVCCLRSKERDGDVGTCMAGRPKLRLPAPDIRHIPRCAGVAPKDGSDALRAGGGILCTTLSGHTDGEHRSSHRGAPLHQRAHRTLHYRRHLEGIKRTAQAIGLSSSVFIS